LWISFHYTTSRRGMIKRSNFIRSKLAFFMRSKVLKKYCLIVQEIEKGLGGHYFRVFSLSLPNLT
jgi:hypothetical protein